MGSLLPQKSIIFLNFLKQFVFVKGQLILFYLSGQNNLAIILTLRLTFQDEDLFLVFSFIMELMDLFQQLASEAQIPQNPHIGFGNYLIQPNLSQPNLMYNLA